MARGKHVKSNKLIIPRGEVKPMTGIITEAPVTQVMDKHTSAIAQLRKEMEQEMKRCNYRNEETRAVLSDKCSKLSDRLDRQQKQINHLQTVTLVIVLYMLAWMIGWGMGAW